MQRYIDAIVTATLIIDGTVAVIIAAALAVAAAMIMPGTW